MTPYANFSYFALLLYVLVPLLFLRLWGRYVRSWLLVATLFLFCVQYTNVLSAKSGDAFNELWLVCLWGVFESGVLLVFLKIRMRPATVTAVSVVSTVLAGAAVDASNVAPVSNASAALAPGPQRPVRVEPRRLPYYIALVLLLAPLIVAKYLPVFAPEQMLGFAGISYVTFRALDVLFGIQSGSIRALPIGRLLAYLLFIPTISSGPVDRYRRFSKDWEDGMARKGLGLDLDAAVHRLFTAFFYKYIIAALISQYWMEVALQSDGPMAIVSYMYAYSFYLFFDFAGYSHFAIAISYLFGVHTPENFNRPFLASNIKDFWNRWHMTLSFWFRDHVYMAFLLAATKKKWFKGRYTAGYVAYFVSFGLMGIWHGPHWYYIIYGLYHAILLSAYDWFARAKKNWRSPPGPPWLWRAGSVALTFQVICFGLLIFSGRLGPGAPPRQTDALIRSSELAGLYEGTLDAANCDVIAGWAWSGAHPDTPVKVDIFADEKYIATVTAREPRTDLRAMAKGNGRHGFHIATPDFLKDGREHSISARISGTSTKLSASFRKIRCPQVSPAARSTVVPGTLPQGLF